MRRKIISKHRTLKHSKHTYRVLKFVSFLFDAHKKRIALYNLFWLADKTADLANYTIFQKINTKYALTPDEKSLSKSRNAMQNAKSFS